MNTLEQVEIAPESRQILWACLKYWETEPLAPEERSVCYSWVERLYRNRFGQTFHQSKLDQLAQSGFLEKADTSRGGNRRYYRIPDANRLRTLLAELGEQS